MYFSNRIGSKESKAVFLLLLAKSIAHVIRRVLYARVLKKYIPRSSDVLSISSVSCWNTFSVEGLGLRLQEGNGVYKPDPERRQVRQGSYHSMLEGIL